jgi:hypothetical protein
LFVAAAVFLGETCLVIGYVVVGGWALVIANRQPASIWMLGVCILALALHLAGFKLFGKAMLADLQSLKSPRRVVALELPNVLVLEDGSRAKLRDIFFFRPVNLMEGTTNYHDVVLDSAGLHRELGLSAYRQEWVQVEIIGSEADYSKATCLRRVFYFCGNTWFPHFFPRRLPRHEREDFALPLVRAGVALPTSNYVMRAAVSWDPLIHAFLGANCRILPLQDTGVVAVAEAFLARNELILGAELLIDIQATNSYPRLKKLMQQASEAPVTGYYYGGFANRETLAPLLMRIDQEECRKALRTAIADSPVNETMLKVAVCSLAELGSLEGYDALVEKLAHSEMDAETRQHLVHFVVLEFNFVPETPMRQDPDSFAADFFEWYRATRAQLTWKHNPDGRKGFSLSDGEVFDEAYLVTMKPYKEAALRRTQPKQ